MSEEPATEHDEIPVKTAEEASNLVPPAKFEPAEGLRAAAFFDLDKTLIAGSSAFYWARAAASTGLVSKRSLALDAWENAKFRLRGSTDEGTAKVWARAGEMIKGHRQVDFRRLSPQVLMGILPRLYPAMLERAWEHQDAGRPIYIATASTQDTAQLLADVLGFDGAVGAPLEEVDGIYTGRLSGPMTYREGKLQAIQQIAARDGLDLRASWAYTDSESDLPMLRGVGHPVAVNPDTDLLAVAEAEGWEIIRLERIGTHIRGAAALTAAVGLGSSVVAARPHIEAVVQRTLPPR